MDADHTSSVGCGTQQMAAPAAVLATALHAYIAVNGAGQVVAWNPAATATFGHTNDQACGHLLDELIIPGRFRAAHRAGLARVVAGGPGRVLGQRLRLIALHHDGHEFPVELTLTATDTTAGPMFHAFAHDVTAEQRASRFAGVEAAVSRGLAEATSSEQAATRVVDALGLRMNWPVCELWLLDEARQVMVCAGRHLDADRRLSRFAFDELDLGVGLPGTVCAQGAARWIPDLAADTGSVRSRLAAQLGLHVAVGVPVRARGHVLGALCVYGDRVEDPQDSLIGLLAGLAAHVGQYLERRRAEELTVELARTKDEFLALVTHEIRNPLAVIVATAGQATDDIDTASTAEHRDHLNSISRSAQRLTTLADDLLDLARLESGHLSITLATTDLREIITDAVAATRPLAADKALTINVKLAARLILEADASRLRQVADNLLSNAVKYTPQQGTITIIADEHDDTIVWSVTDTGIGIPAADRPRLFRRFYRASTAADRRIPGTGLGLVISRTIIERHGGTITLAEQPGPGATFTIQLPIKAFIT